MATFPAEGPRRVPDLLDEGLALARHRPRFVSALLMAAVLPAALVSALTLGPEQVVGFAEAFDASTQQDLAGIALVADVLVQLAGLALVTAGLALVASEPEISSAQLVRRLARRLPALLSLWLIQLVASLVGAVALVVGALVPLVYLSVAVPVMIIEGSGPVAAARRSARLNRGSFWATLWVLVALAIVGLVLSAVASIGASELVAQTVGERGWPLVAVIQAVAGVAPLVVIGGGLVGLYADRRARREGADLEARMTRLASDADTAYVNDRASPADGASSADTTPLTGAG